MTKLPHAISFREYELAEINGQIKRCPECLSLNTDHCVTNMMKDGYVLIGATCGDCGNVWRERRYNLEI